MGPHFLTCVLSQYVRFWLTVVLEKLQCKIRLDVFLAYSTDPFSPWLCAMLQSQRAISQQSQKYCRPSERAPVED